MKGLTSLLMSLVTLEPLLVPVLLAAFLSAPLSPTLAESEEQHPGKGHRVFSSHENETLHGCLSNSFQRKRRHANATGFRKLLPIFSEDDHDYEHEEAALSVLTGVGDIRGAEVAICDDGASPSCCPNYGTRPIQRRKRRRRRKRKKRRGVKRSNANFEDKDAETGCPNAKIQPNGALGSLPENSPPERNVGVSLGVNGLSWGSSRCLLRISAERNSQLDSRQGVTRSGAQKTENKLDKEPYASGAPASVASSNFDVSDEDLFCAELLPASDRPQSYTLLGSVNSKRTAPQTTSTKTRPYQRQPLRGVAEHTDLNNGLNSNSCQASGPRKELRKLSLTISDDSVSPWVRKFLATRPKDCLLPVPREYLLDTFNLVRLAPVVEHWATINRRQPYSRHVPEQEEENSQKKPFALHRQALDLLLRVAGEEDSDSDSKAPVVVEHAAEILYTLAHARFVVSPRGLDTLRTRMRVHGSRNPKKALVWVLPPPGVWRHAAVAVWLV